MHTTLNKKTRICLALLAGVLGCAAPAIADQDINKALIDLLVKKGVLTQEDVASLRQEIAAQQAQPPPPAQSAPAQPAPEVEAAPSGPIPLAPGGGPAYSGA